MAAAAGTAAAGTATPFKLADARTHQDAFDHAAAAFNTVEPRNRTFLETAEKINGDAAKLMTRMTSSQTKTEEEQTAWKEEVDTFKAGYETTVEAVVATRQVVALVDGAIARLSGMRTEYPAQARMESLEPTWGTVCKVMDVRANQLELLGAARETLGKRVEQARQTLIETAKVIELAQATAQNGGTKPYLTGSSWMGNPALYEAAKTRFETGAVPTTIHTQYTSERDAMKYVAGGALDALISAEEADAAAEDARYGGFDMQKPFAESAAGATHTTYRNTAVSLRADFTKYHKNITAATNALARGAAQANARTVEIGLRGDITQVRLIVLRQDRAALTDILGDVSEATDEARGATGGLRHLEALVNGVDELHRKHGLPTVSDAELESLGAIDPALRSSVEEKLAVATKQWERSKVERLPLSVRHLALHGILETAHAHKTTIEAHLARVDAEIARREAEIAEKAAAREAAAAAPSAEAASGGGEAVA